MAIYTKKGDKGKTSLGSGVRVSKHNDRVEAYGTVDELNSYLGVILSDLASINKKYKKEYITILLTIQNDLFCIGSYLANPAQKKLLTPLPDHTKVFEKQIDEMTDKMPELTNFILPGGSKIGAELQYARTIVRRTERRLSKLVEKEQVTLEVIQYINRLSDLFFTMSRYANNIEKKKETVWNS